MIGRKSIQVNRMGQHLYAIPFDTSFRDLLSHGLPCNCYHIRRSKKLPEYWTNHTPVSPMPITSNETHVHFLTMYACRRKSEQTVGKGVEAYITFHSLSASKFFTSYCDRREPGCPSTGNRKESNGLRVEELGQMGPDEPDSADEGMLRERGKMMAHLGIAQSTATHDFDL